MPSPKQPSDLYPAFTWSRLIALAKIMFDAREWVANDAKWHMGDSRCGVGFRAWEHTKFAVTKAAANEYAEWLSITDGSSVFKFKLNMMPIRFFRGDSEDALPPKYAFADVTECADTDLAFEEAGQVPVKGVFRFVIQADPKGFPLGVSLVHAVDGIPTMIWAIPRSEDGTGVAPVVVPQTPIILGPLTVESVEEAERKEREEREEAERAKAGRDTSNEKGA